jgi:hypothetical protein
MTTPARNDGSQSVQTLRKSITFADIGSTLEVGVVPTGSIVDYAYVIVSTAFDSGSTDVLDIGTSADTNGFATVMTLQTAGRIVADELATSNDLGPYTADTTLKCVVAATGTAATAGAAEVVVRFIADN